MVCPLQRPFSRNGEVSQKRGSVLQSPDSPYQSPTVKWKSQVKMKFWGSLSTGSNKQEGQVGCV